MWEHVEMKPSIVNMEEKRRADGVSDDDESDSGGGSFGDGSLLFSSSDNFGSS